MTSLFAATLGPSSNFAAYLSVSGGLGVALPCKSAKRSRFLPEVFDGCSSVSRGLSLRERAIIREVNETVVARNFLEMDGIVGSGHGNTVGRYVDPVFQHTRRPYVDFVHDLVKAGSAGFVGTAVEHVGLFFSLLPRRLEKQLTFFETSVWTAAHRGGTPSCRIP